MLLELLLNAVHFFAAGRLGDASEPVTFVLLLLDLVLADEGPLIHAVLDDRLRPVRHRALKPQRGPLIHQLRSSADLVLGLFVLRTVLLHLIQYRKPVETPRSSSP